MVRSGPGRVRRSKTTSSFSLSCSRDGSAVLDRLLKIVDAHAVAEEVARPFLARDERGARERDEQRVRQGSPHVGGERLVLGPVRLVGDHDHVPSAVEHLRGLELVDQVDIDLPDSIQDEIDRAVHLLEERGPTLPFPHSSDIRGSKHGNMRELRVQIGGEPYRIFYAFDPRRAALLLIGGNKGGDDQFYQRMVPLADRIYDQHLRELERERKE